MARCIAEWGPKIFEVSPNKIVPIGKLSTKFVRKSEANEDTSGTAATNTRGIELQQIVLETTYLAAAGVDPRAELESWESLFGKYYSLYINGWVFGPSLLELNSVEFPNIVMDNNGAFIQVDAVITLISHPNVSSQNGYYESVLTKEAALAAKPTSEEKEARSNTPVR